MSERKEIALHHIFALAVQNNISCQEIIDFLFYGYEKELLMDEYVVQPFEQVIQDVVCRF